MNAADRQALRRIALDSIHFGLTVGHPMAIDVNALPPSLQEKGASFVTLEINGELRGCIGTLEAHRRLAVDVAHNAYSAAFGDSRFVPVTVAEEPLLELHISVLSKPEPMSVRDEEDLLQQLRPGIDGLILRDGLRRATFLPSVWEQLPNPRDFLVRLKQKAGMPATGWRPSISVERYTCEIF